MPIVFDHGEIFEDENRIALNTPMPLPDEVSSQKKKAPVEIPDFPDNEEFGDWKQIFNGNIQNPQESLKTLPDDHEMFRLRGEWDKKDPMYMIRKRPEAPVRLEDLQSSNTPDEMSSQSRKEAPLSEEEETFLAGDAAGVTDIQKEYPTPTGATAKRGVINTLTGADGKERYQLWPEKMVRSILSAAALPGDVMSGVAADDPRSFNRAVDLAGLAVLAPAPIAKKIADGTLGSFAGVRAAKTASNSVPENSLQHAERLIKEGTDPEDVYAMTSWFKGIDDKWRYEISDHNAKINLPRLKDDEFIPLSNKIGGMAGWTEAGGQVGKNSEYISKDVIGNTYKLHEVLDHPELFKMYPALNSVDVSFRTLPQNTMGQFHIKEGMIDLDIKKLDMHADKLKSVLLHEVQHWIQKEEGFLQGASDKGFVEATIKHLEDRMKGRNEMLEFTNQSWKTDPQMLEWGQLWHELKNNKGYYNKTDSDKDLGFYLYRKTPGEIEARIVQARRDWTNEQRWRESPDKMRKRMVKEQTPYGDHYEPTILPGVNVDRYFSKGAVPEKSSVSVKPTPESLRKREPR